MFISILTGLFIKHVTCFMLMVATEFGLQLLALNLGRLTKFLKNTVTKRSKFAPSELLYQQAVHEEI